jgi:hypothetical protein
MAGEVGPVGLEDDVSGGVVGIDVDGVAAMPLA